MVDIMKNLHKYVSSLTTQSKETIPGSDIEVETVKDTFHNILFGGDQMTAAHACGTSENL